MLLPGLDGQAGRGEAAVDQVRPVLDLLQLAFDDADQGVQVGGSEVGMAGLSSDQMPSKLWRSCHSSRRAPGLQPSRAGVIAGQARISVSSL